MNAERNAATEAIAKLKRSGGDASAEIEKTRSLGDRIKELQAAFNEAEEKLNALAMLCPNLPHPSVPDGKTPADNKVAKTWGKLPPESQVFPHHLEIGEKLKQVGIRATVDTSSDKLGAKIRRAELDKVPYTFVLGQKEAEAQSVSVRSRAKGDEGVQPFAQFFERLKAEIAARALPEKKAKA